MKQSISDLAIFGATPEFSTALHVGRPNVGSSTAFFDRAKEVLEHRWLTNNGPIVQELERRIADFLGVKHVIAMCNATVALEVTARALNLEGEVIVPSLTFIATAHALQWQKIMPVFCDVDANTHNLDPAKVESLISPRTSGILGVHLWGRPCCIEALTQIASRHKLALVFDAAHAFANSYKGRMIGNFGNAEVFSFHATKFFNTFEGGAVTTNNDELAQKVRAMKNFGFANYDDVIYVGTNGKMTEMAAAMGLTNLESLGDFLAANRRNHETYLRFLYGLKGVYPVMYDSSENVNCQYVVIELSDNETGLERDTLLAILRAENVLARRYFYPGCHRMEPYKSSSSRIRLTETERLSGRLLALPTGTAVGEKDIERICQIVSFSIHNSVEIKQRLQGTKTDPSPFQQLL